MPESFCVICKPDEVNKVIDPQFGLKDLVVFDGDQINFKLNEREKLDALARDNAQLIFNQLFDRKKLERSGLQCQLLYIVHKYHFSRRRCYSCRTTRARLRWSFCMPTRETLTKEESNDKMGSVCQTERYKRKEKEIQNGLV